MGEPTSEFVVAGPWYHDDETTGAGDPRLHDQQGDYLDHITMSQQPDGYGKVKKVQTMQWEPNRSAYTHRHPSPPKYAAGGDPWLHDKQKKAYLDHMGQGQSPNSSRTTAYQLASQATRRPRHTHRPATASGDLLPPAPTPNVAVSSYWQNPPPPAYGYWGLDAAGYPPPPPYGHGGGNGGYYGYGAPPQQHMGMGRRAGGYGTYGGYGHHQGRYGHYQGGYDGGYGQY